MSTITANVEEVPVAVRSPGGDFSLAWETVRDQITEAARDMSPSRSNGRVPAFCEEMSAICRRNGLTWQQYLSRVKITHPRPGS